MLQFTVIVPSDRHSMSPSQSDWIDERFGWEDLNFLVMIPATANAAMFIAYLADLTGHRNWESFVVDGFVVGWLAAFKHS